MSLTHLLDTSVYCQPLRKKPLAAVQRRWRELGDAWLGISAICELEVLQGLEMKNSKRLWEMYRSILRDRLPILPVDRAVAESYAPMAAAVRAKGQPRPQFDLLIAATAAAHGLTIATCDPGHFVGIDGVKTEDWSA